MADDNMEPQGVEELPMDRSAWQECVIVEDIGEQNEHRDQFYRYGDYGIEACRHGYPDLTPDYEPYVIIGGHPYHVHGYCGSFEEAVAVLMHETLSKRLEEGAFKPEDPEEVEVKMEFDGDEIAKSSITSMIAKKQEGRKVPIKDEGPRMPDIADGRLMTPRANYRTVHIGEGRNPSMPKDIKQTDGAPGCTSKKVPLKHH